MRKIKTLVMGASPNTARYSNLATRELVKNHHQVIAFGRRPGKIGHVNIETELKNYEDIDTVTLYLNPVNQREYYYYIISLKPRRIIFNPGTENTELIELAKKNGIIPEIACTLVLLSLSSY